MGIGGSGVGVSKGIADMGKKRNRQYRKAMNLLNRRAREALNALEKMAEGASNFCGIDLRENPVAEYQRTIDQVAQYRRNLAAYLFESRDTKPY